MLTIHDKRKILTTVPNPEEHSARLIRSVCKLNVVWCMLAKELFGIYS